jgi:hypothetical protein
MSILFCVKIRIIGPIKKYKKGAHSHKFITLGGENFRKKNRNRSEIKTPSSLHHLITSSPLLNPLSNGH